MPSLRLLPFPGEPVSDAITVDVALAREGDRASAAFHIAFPAGRIVVPPPARARARREGLWRSTCVELFIGARGRPGYLELNLAPSGDWDAYRFDSCRGGMRPLEDPRFTSPPAVQEADGTLVLAMSLGLPEDLASAASLDVGVSAVLEHDSGARTYWALVHRGERPDFHRRDSFVQSL